MGPVPAQVVEEIALTFVGDISDQASRFEDPEREGSIITISITASNINTTDRVPVPPEAARLWLHAILGNTWIEHITAAGPLTGITTNLTTEYYHLFLGPDGKAHQPPAHFISPTRPLTP